jgi:UDP:flavonoid glycosyltransferase YjiC (YdhE family)
MRIAFVSPPFAGHFNPLLALAVVARDAGFDIDFITGPRKFPMLEANAIRPVALSSIGADTLEAIANTAQPVRSNPLRLLAQFRENLGLLPAIRAELLQLWKAGRPTLVVADSVAPVAGLVCEQLGIPWITTIATPFSIEQRRGAPAYCGGWLPAAGLLGGVLGGLRDAAGRAAIHGFKRAAGRLFRRELRALGLAGLYRADGSEAIYSPHAILGFGLRELEFERDWPAAFQMIGPLIAPPERPPVLLLPETRPRVLVTHGTHLLWAKRTLVADAIALSRALPRIELAVSLGEPERAGQADERPAERVRVVPFVPYGPCLSEFDAVIHHGGAGVTYAAILAGLPNLVVPRDYDQFDYAARIVYHRLGLRIGSLAGRAAAESLERLLDRKQWTAPGRFQQYAQAYTPEKTFVETVRRLSHSL